MTVLRSVYRWNSGADARHRGGCSRAGLLRIRAVRARSPRRDRIRLCPLRTFDPPARSSHSGRYCIADFAGSSALFHMIGMGLARSLFSRSADQRSSRAVQTVLKIAALDGMAEMRIMTTLRRVEPIVASGIVAGTSLANNMSNDRASYSKDVVGGSSQLASAAISTTVSAVSNSC